MNYDARVAFEPPDERTRPLAGASGTVATALATGLSLYALYWVLFVVQPQIYRVSFLLIALVLAFLLYPRVRGSAAPVATLDWLLIVGAIALLRLATRRLLLLHLPRGDAVGDRHRARCRRHCHRARSDAANRRLDPARHGGGVPRLRADYGPLRSRSGLPWLAHRGYGLDRLVGNLYMTLEGMFGVPLDVAATYIILFTIYGAVLEASGPARSSSIGRWRRWAVPSSARSAWARGDARGLPARHRVGQRRRHDRDAGIGGVAAAEATRVTAPRPAGRSFRPPASARCCRRRRWAPRRF